MSRGTARDAASRELVECYSELARSGRHLLHELLDGSPPRQWEHYPADDAFDSCGVYQWYYHSHSPEDRPGATEHGHFHLFARTDSLEAQATGRSERAFLARLGATPCTSTTRHLVCIGLTAQGLPCSLFTVNSWVTGDQLLSVAATLKLLEQIRLDTGHVLIDRVLAAVLHHSHDRLAVLFRDRDQALIARRDGKRNVLLDETLEELSFLPLCW